MLEIFNMVWEFINIHPGAMLCGPLAAIPAALASIAPAAAGGAAATAGTAAATGGLAGSLGLGGGLATGVNALQGGASLLNTLDSLGGGSSAPGAGRPAPFTPTQSNPIYGQQYVGGNPGFSLAPQQQAPPQGQSSNNPFDNVQNIFDQINKLSAKPEQKKV